MRDDMRNRRRIVAACVVTPWVPVLPTLLSGDGDFAVPLYGSYLLTLAIGLSLHRFLKAWRRESVLGFAIGGMGVTALLAGGFVLVEPGMPGREAGALPAILTGYGTLMGTVFGVIAGLPFRASAREPSHHL